MNSSSERLSATPEGIGSSEGHRLRQFAGPIAKENGVEPQPIEHEHCDLLSGGGLPSTEPPRPPLALALKEDAMAEDREKISTGPNEEPINETIAGTGPGIPDDALAPGEQLPEAPSDEEVERIAEKLGSPTAEEDTLPLEGE
jgi:hypothetical protein